MKYLAIIMIGLILVQLLPISAFGYSIIIIEVEEKDTSIFDKYDVTIIDELNYTFNGYIVKIRTDHIDDLRMEPLIKNIYYDKKVEIIKSEQRNLALIGIDNLIQYNGMNITGKGVTLALIDTGVDYTHDVLKGFGNDKKVIGGYDFLDDDNDPLDNDGHGTMVAGIIAGNGAIKGVAPDAKILAYKIASNNRYVSTSEMIQAMEKAAEDNADIINISIGLDHIDKEIDRSINNLVENGIIVVAAAGNNGESGFNSIKSPGSALKAITVGATYNDPSEALFATLKIDEYVFHPIPMADSITTDKPIRAKIVFVNYASKDDLKDIELNGAIALAERGGPIKFVNGIEEKELLYFSDKEYNAANKGASAIIVYNNEEGIFRGKLVHENAIQGYKPRIPAISLSQDEGLSIKELLKNRGEVVAELGVYNNPNAVAEFSSKGPVSPFYMKPDLVAPGVSVNSTYLGNTYNLSTGTSFAAPHVSGAAALLLQLHPELKPEEVASILITTADPLVDQYNNYYSFDVTGAGKLNVKRAIKSNLIALPYYAILYISPSMNGSSIINLRSIEGKIGDIDAHIELFTDNNLNLELNSEIIDEKNIKLIINASTNEVTNTKYEGRINIRYGEERISIPLMIYVSEVSINAFNEDGLIKLSVDLDKEWESARVKVINPENNFERILTLTPTKNTLDIKPLNIGEHWIEVSILSNDEVIESFSKLYVSDVKNNTWFYIDDFIPIDVLLIIFGFLSSIIMITVILRKKSKKKSIIDDFY
ncbi:MAG: S8 family serine peptidase [Candidatus Nitrosocaldaceae archaeon]